MDVSITYYGPLAYSDGALEFVFPMVVGPRYNPPRYNPPRYEAGIGVAPRGAPDSSGQAVAVQYLKPGERSTHDIRLSVLIHAGIPIQSLSSPSHDIRPRVTGPTTAEVLLAESDRLPNRDFILRIGLAADQVQSGVVASSTSRGGFFSLLIVPPRTLEDTARGPVEMVFVLDASGSMQGQPIDQGKRAITRALQRLNTADTFQIINFSSSASALGSAPITAKPENVRRGVAYLDAVQAEGGTEMLTGLRAALDFPHDPERLRYVVFATDAYIGNEDQVLGALDERLRDARVFSLGLGSSVNRFLIDAMARMGSGFATVLPPGDSPNEVIDALMNRVSHAALHDVSLDFGGAGVRETYPSRVPDVYVGRPVLLLGRFDGAPPSSVRISGRAGGRRFEMQAPVTLVSSGLASEALGPLWARAKITDLADRAAWQRDRDYAGEVRELALQWSLLSSYTAFVAVDTLHRTEGDSGTTVAVPVPMPAGVKYETTAPPGGESLPRAGGR